MNAIKVPEPIMREGYIRNGDGSHLTLSVPARGDHKLMDWAYCGQHWVR